jgi:hypothetical protein
MRSSRLACASLLAGTLCSGFLVGQTAVPAWNQLFRPPATGPVYDPPIASRELADGTVLVITNSLASVRYDHAGNPLSSVQLPVSGSRAGKNQAPMKPERPEGYLIPPGYFEPDAVIDAFGSVVVASLGNPDQFAHTGDIVTQKFDGLTGRPLWAAPAIYDSGLANVDFSTGIFLDRSGDVIVTGFSGYDHVSLKYDGMTGAAIWGPALLGAFAYTAVATVDGEGNVVVSTVGGTGIQTIKYSGLNGAPFWGPVVYDSGNYDAPGAVGADESGNPIVAGSAGGRVVVLKYSAQTAGLLWAPVFLTAPTDPGATVTGLLVDPNGNIFVSARATDSRYLTFKIAGQGQPLWGPALGEGAADPGSTSMSLAGNGDVILSGLTRSGSETNISLWRFRGSTGVPVWGPATFGPVQQSYDGSPSFAFVVSNGRIFGTVVLVATGINSFELDGESGAPVWGPKPFVPPAVGRILFEDLQVGPDGSVFAVGDDRATIQVLKYDGATGEALWGPISFGAPDTTNLAWQLAVDAAGDVFLLGYTSSGVAGAMVLKYSGTDGALLWGPTILAGVDGPERIVIDSGGNAIVAGWLIDATYYHYHSALAKVSGATGAALWGPVVYESDPSQDDFPRSLAVDGAGNPLVAGDTWPPGAPPVWFVLKYSGADGSLLWGPAPTLEGQPWGTAVDAAGDLIVTGSGAAMTTVKYSGMDGSVLWGPLVVHGTTGYGGQGVAIAVDAAGDVVAAGSVGNVGSNDSATIKYRGADGATLWGPVFSGGEFPYLLGLGFDNSGNVVVGGTSHSSSRCSDLAVFKYDGATGATLWGPVFAGGPDSETMNGFGVHGDLVVAGGPSGGAMLIQAWNEDLGMETPSGSLAPAFCGQSYAFAFVARNGTTPYSWSVVSGNLPPGMTLSTTGILSGAPLGQDFYVLDVHVQDSAGHGATRTFTLVVQGGAPLPMYRSQVDCQFTLNEPGPWTSYLWLPGGETTPSITVQPIEPTTYGLIVSDANGCTWSASITLAGSLLDPACGAPTVSSVDPGSGPSTGGTSIAISGAKFQPGAVVTIGGVATTDVAIVDPTAITATTPALGAGHAYDVMVLNPDTGNAALLKGWFVDFLDVPPSNIFHADVEIVARSGITAGCGDGNYCPDASVTRAQMAVFLLRAEHGSSFLPPSSCAGYFLDVPCSDPFANWIEALYLEGITAGCGGNNYCPNSSVSRAQTAVFLLKTLLGTAYVPPLVPQIFDDVPPGAFAADWINDLSLRAITAGCSASPSLYCPGNPVSRGQMAPLLVKTFGLS